MASFGHVEDRYFLALRTLFIACLILSPIIPNIISKLKSKTNKGNVKEKVGNAKKLALKMQKAIQRYVSTMEFYERNKHILQRERENNTSSYSTKTFNKRKSFMEYLTAAVDHKQAIKNVENKKNARPNIRPRIID